jgi:hypothetical protein
MMIGDFPCQWGACSARFNLESELFLHLKSHTSTLQNLSCAWRICKRATVYDNKGYLSDHIISHMSKAFISVYCLGCRTGYRNRQALSRHQKKTTCSGSYHGSEIPESPLELPVHQVSNDLIVSILNDSSLSPETIVKGRSLDAIIKEETQGNFRF